MRFSRSVNPETLGFLKQPSYPRSKRTPLRALQTRLGWVKRRKTVDFRPVHRYISETTEGWAYVLQWTTNSIAYGLSFHVIVSITLMILNVRNAPPYAMQLFRSSLLANKDELILSAEEK